MLSGKPLEPEGMKSLSEYLRVKSAGAEAGKALAAGQPAPSLQSFFSGPPGGVNPPAGQKAPISTGPAGANAPGDQGAPVTPVDTQQQPAPSIASFFSRPIGSQNWNNAAPAPSDGNQTQAPAPSLAEYFSQPVDGNQTGGQE